MHLPLEKLLEAVCNSDRIYSTQFPNHVDNYFEKYTGIVNKLKRSVYPSINLGLAVSSGDIGIYTDHGEEHFDEVVKYAGYMLGLNTEADIENALEEVVNNKWHFYPYEIYILLLCIRFHDVGNIHGREQHEHNIMKVMHGLSFYNLEDPNERKMVSRIAGSHGGKTLDGNKDTIGNLEKGFKISNVVDIRQQRIAGVVRFADEICENRNRNHSPLLTIPEGNEVYHKYTEIIKANCLTNSVFDIHYDIHKSDAIKTWGKTVDDDVKQVYLTEEIISRLTKMELERRYCNRFLPEDVRINSISVEIEIYADAEVDYGCPEVIRKESFVLEDSGYPSHGDGIIPEETCNKISGETLIQELSE